MVGKSRVAEAGRARRGSKAGAWPLPGRTQMWVALGIFGLLAFWCLRQPLDIPDQEVDVKDAVGSNIRRGRGRRRAHGVERPKEKETEQAAATSETPKGPEPEVPTEPPKDWEPMTFARMQAVDVAGMVRREAAGIAFYTYPDTEDIWISGVITGDTYYKKWASDGFCERFRTLRGKADFLDVGANIGAIALPMAKCLQECGQGGNVIAVEAVPEIANHLAASAVANNFMNVHLYQAAVGREGQPHTARMRLSVDNKGASYVVDSDSMLGGLEVIVPRTTIDNILELGEQRAARVFLMKMNIQGQEINALEGSVNSLQGDARPCHIFIELKENQFGPETFRAYATRLLDGWGYEVAEQRDWDVFFKRKDLDACLLRFAS